MYTILLVPVLLIGCKSDDRDTDSISVEEGLLKCTAIVQESADNGWHGTDIITGCVISGLEGVLLSIKSRVESFFVTPGLSARRSTTPSRGRFNNYVNADTSTARAHLLLKEHHHPT